MTLGYSSGILSVNSFRDSVGRFFGVPFLLHVLHDISMPLPTPGDLSDHLRPSGPGLGGFLQGHVSKDAA